MISFRQFPIPYYRRALTNRSLFPPCHLATIQKGLTAVDLVGAVVTVRCSVTHPVQWNAIGFVGNTVTSELICFTHYSSCKNQDHASISVDKNDTIPLCRLLLHHSYSTPTQHSDLLRIKHKQVGCKQWHCLGSHSQQKVRSQIVMKVNIKVNINENVT